MKKIIFIQSADTIRYRDFLKISGRGIQEYCVNKGHIYNSTLGVLHGTKPWHAALNRILVIQGLMHAGFKGWIIHVDADAYIADMDFDLAEYLKSNDRYALIAAPSGLQPPRWWDINNGVFALNSEHPLAKVLIDAWAERLFAVSDIALSSEERWGDVMDDQRIMHEALCEIPDMENATHRTDGPDAVFNWNSRFIRQIVRETGTISQRLHRLSLAVDSSLKLDHQSCSVENSSLRGRDLANEEFISAIYQTLLGREADPPGFVAALSELNSGRRNFQDELNSCLKCDEFADKIIDFLDRNLSEASKEKIKLHYRSPVNK